MSPAKLLVLGVDAASPDLLVRWAGDGTMPFFGSLLNEGMSGSIRGLDGFFIGSTWPSFYTGTSPAQHGIHYGVQIRPGTYDYYRPEEEDLLVRQDPFWRRPSQLGRRMAILDVPLTQLDTSINGIHLVEWGSHDALYGFQAWPEAVGEAILARFGPHPLGSSCDAANRNATDYGQFLATLQQAVRTKTDLTCTLLGQEPWDFFMQVFTEAHCAGHQCWHLHDPAHPGYDGALAGRLGDPLRGIYREMDRALERIVTDAGDATVVVLAAHGMSHWYGAQILLSRILFDLGVAVSRAPEMKPRSAQSILQEGMRQAWGRLPEPLRAVLRPLRVRLGPRQPPPARWTLDADPGRSKCFAVGNGFAVGAIRLNLVGREPSGIVTPGAEAEALMNDLEAELLTIRDAESGLPLVRRVLRTGSLYRGERLDALPDLLVEWDDATPRGSSSVGDGAGAVVRAVSPRLGSLEGVNSFGRTGEHRRDGLFVARGAGIVPVRLEAPVSILDFAPTFQACLGVAPTPSEGEPIAALVSACRWPR